MADRYEIANVDDAAAWNQFVNQAPGGSIFSTAGWLDCASAASGGRIHRLGYFKNGQLLAVLSGLESRGTGLTRFTTPPLTPHGGLLLAPLQAKTPAKPEAEFSRAAQAFIEHLQGQFDYVQLCQAPSMVDVRDFAWAGWQARIRYTYHLEIADEAAMWERFERRTRTVIRKAERDGFVVRPTTDVDLFRRQFEMVQQRQEGYAVDKAMVAEFVTAAMRADLAELCLVESAAGAPAAVVAFARASASGDVVYAWQAGADPAFNHTGALSLLYWKYLTGSPCTRFDFVGANMPSVAFFKRGFGGNLVPYYVLEGYRNTWVKSARAGRSLLRRWIGR